VEHFLWVNVTVGCCEDYGQAMLAAQLRSQRQPLAPASEYKHRGIFYYKRYIRLYTCVDVRVVRIARSCGSLCNSSLVSAAARLHRRTQAA
jgi:hypothetical protein